MQSVRTILLLLGVFLLSSCACKRIAQQDSMAQEEQRTAGNIPGPEIGAELADVNFSFDSSALDTRAQGILRGDARWLMDNPGKSVIVEGHCDERGTSAYNMALGERRARAAYDFLRNLGVKGERMSTISYGKEIPLDPGHNEAAWAKNRRAHFTLKK